MHRLEPFSTHTSTFQDAAGRSPPHVGTAVHMGLLPTPSHNHVRDTYYINDFFKCISLFLFTRQSCYLIWKACIMVR